MAVYRSRYLQRFLNAWPGKRTLGLYRFLPIFFVLGAALEFSMINWRVGETNFYNTYKKRRAEDIFQERLHSPRGITALEKSTEPKATNN